MLKTFNFYNYVFWYATNIESSTPLNTSPLLLFSGREWVALETIAVIERVRYHMRASSANLFRNKNGNSGDEWVDASIFMNPIVQEYN